MKIDLREIWNFIDIAPKPVAKGPKKEWFYHLVAGNITYKDLGSKDVIALKEDESYDTELLPSIFTFREILWQPNVYTQPSLCLPQLNILKVFCEDYISNREEQDEDDGTLTKLYFHLLEGMGKFCQEALDSIENQDSEVRIASILGDLRKKTFPIVKFFLFHPMNREDYRIDAMNRLNYAVKIMLTQYNNKYYDLEDPYWVVEQKKVKPPATKKSGSKADSGSSKGKKDQEEEDSK